MEVAVREYSHVEYPEDPGECSVHCGNYHGRTLRLARKDATHFDFILDPSHPHVAKIVFRDVDVTNGKIATPFCRIVIREAFLPSSVPTEMCREHGE